MHANKGPSNGTFHFGLEGGAEYNGDEEVDRGHSGSGGVMRVDGSGVVHVGSRTTSVSTDAKSPDGRRQSTLWSPLGCQQPDSDKPIGRRHGVTNNIKLTPLNISSASNLQDSSLQNSTSTMIDRQQQEHQQQQQQQPQEHMKLWKRFGDPTPLSPATPTLPLGFGMSPMSPTTRGATPMTPISGLPLDPNDPFFSAFMKRIPDAKFDERTGTLSGLTMWFLGKLTDLDTKMLSKESLESLFREDEIEGFRKVFATFDTGGCGRLDRKEIGALMEAAEMNITEERTDFLFELMDKNRSGFVEWEDFLVHMYKDKLERIDRIFTSAASAKSASEVAKAQAQNASFTDPKNAGPDRLAETDCWESTMLSGLISAEQLHHALVQNGQTNYSMSQVRRLVSLYDDDRDGYLDREDLLRML